MVIGCRSVAKTQRNLLFLIKIFIVFPWKYPQISRLALNRVLAGLVPTGVRYQAGYKAVVRFAYGHHPTACLTEGMEGRYVVMCVEWLKVTNVCTAVTLRLNGGNVRQISDNW
jgi:hypothetical protein